MTVTKNVEKKEGNKKHRPIHPANADRSEGGREVRRRAEKRG